jgi:hypothetical protein
VKLLSLTAIAVLATTGNVGLGDWITLSRGAPPDSLRACMGYTRRAFEVASTPQGGVTIRESAQRDIEAPPIDPRSFRLPAWSAWHSISRDDGRLIGFDAGEFGGGLWWLPSSGETAVVALSGVPKWARNVVALFDYATGPLVFVGLAHLNADFGAVLRCVKQDGEWQTVTLAALAGAPLLAVRERDDSVLFVTTEGIGRVTPAGRQIALLRRSLGNLYPGSLVVDQSGWIYVGMRDAVLRLSPSGREEWLIPPGHIDRIRERCGAAADVPPYPDRPPR